MTPEINKLFDKLEAIEKDYVTYEKRKVEKKGLDYPLSKVHRNYARGLILEIHDKGKMTFAQIHDEIGAKYPRLRQVVDSLHKEVLVSGLPIDLDVSSRILGHLKPSDPRRASHKKTRRKHKKKKTKRQARKPLTDERYHALVQRRRTKKRISKSDKKSLDKEMNQRFCKCLRAVKYSKKIKKGSQYPICMRSIYKNRGFDVPRGVIKNCSKTKS
jgi:hypothetical protein